MTLENTYPAIARRKKHWWSAVTVSYTQHFFLISEKTLKTWKYLKDNEH